MKNKLEKILWLEDDIGDFEISKIRLNKHGFDVDLVDDIEKFREKLVNQKYRLVLVDIKGEHKFNGMEVIRSDEFDYKGASLCVLSGNLSEPPIKNSLRSLEREIYVLDKKYPFGEDYEGPGLEAQLRNIISDGTAHTNRTYFEEVNESEFDVLDGKTTYERYNQLNPSEKLFVKNAILEQAEEKMSDLEEDGYIWFLVCGPNGEILDKRKEVHELSSKEISQYSAAQGFPCVTETRLPHGIRNEETRTVSCGGMYKYYFSIKIAFDGSEGEVFDLHFDSGSNLSWFDIRFLKGCNIGKTGDDNASTYLNTANGPKRVYYYAESWDIAVYYHESENFEFTTLQLRGLYNWDDMVFSGFTKKKDDLCERCRTYGRCLDRVALLGADVIREPNPLKLVLDGHSGKAGIF